MLHCTFSFIIFLSHNLILGDKVNYVLTQSAEAIGKGLLWTGERTNELIGSSAKSYVSNNPSLAPKPISNNVKKGVEYAATGTKYVAKGKFGPMTYYEFETV